MENDLPLLEIKDLHVSMNETPILKGLNLTIFPGEIHAIMGPNGSGKSTCAKVLAGHPSYLITEGKILFQGKDISHMEPQERSHLGLFLGFQYPVEIPGINASLFFEKIYETLQERKLFEKTGTKPVKSVKYKRESSGPVSITRSAMKESLELVDLNEGFLFGRGLNEGFSGGEKKRNEIFQFALLDSQLGILDEIDSGLDIDALQTISKALNKILQENKKKSLILITHYKRLLEYLEPDFIHILKDGKIIRTGDAKLADVLEEKGYEWLNML